MENIDIDIDIDRDILENIDIDINIDKDILENIDIDIDIDKEILENIDIDIDIDKDILENIDIDKISNRLEFGISNRASSQRVVAAVSLFVNNETAMLSTTISMSTHKVSSSKRTG